MCSPFLTVCNHEAVTVLDDTELKLEETKTETFSF